MSVSDIDIVSHIEAGIYEFPWSKKNFADALLAGYQGVCLWLDDAIIGYAVIMKAVDECHLLNISVTKSKQRQGWGQYLLDWCQNTAQSTGCIGVLLEVRPSNEVAKYIYERVGFKLIGVRKNYYPAPLGREDAVVMFKKFSEIKT